MQKMNTTKLNKIKNIVTNQYFIIAFLTIAAILIRLINIDKSNGLWLDEMLTYIFSSKDSVLDVIKELYKEDYHMPFYYIYAHFWMKLFGTNDVVMRLSSVIWGALTVPAFFYLGKTYRSKLLGYILAVFCCMSPILVYYSQEFRFYSMLVFFATTSLIFFLKLLDNPNKKHFWGFAISNLVILYIYTMGAIFVGAEFLILVTHTYLYKKEKLKLIFKNSAIFMVLSMPYLLLIFSYMNAANQWLATPFFNASLKIYTPFNILNDFFTPLTLNIYNPNTLSPYKPFFENNNTILYLSFLCIPTYLFICGFVKGLFNFEKKLLYFILILLSIILTELHLNITGGFAITTRYLLIIYPILLTICTDGILSIKNNIIVEFFILIILTVYSIPIIKHKEAPEFMNRYEGLNVPITTLNKEFNNINKNDYILYPLHSKLLKKYIQTSNFIDFSSLKVLYLDKTGKEKLKVFNPKVLTLNKNEKEKFVEEYILNPEPTDELTNYINSAVKEIPKRGRLILIEDAADENLLNLLSDLKLATKYDKNAQNAYNKKNIFYFFYLRTYYNIKKILKNNPSIKEIKTLQTPKTQNKWEIIIYKKI